jgi:esterase/lipase superfamily enzyme
MYFISYRANFWGDDIPSGSDAIREIPLPATVVEVDVTDAAFMNFVANQRVLVLIHGYRNTRADITAGYCMIEKASNQAGILQPPPSPNTYDAVIGLTWPGGITHISYPFAKLLANAVSDKVWARLRRVLGAAKSVDIMTHSLGARVVLKALQNATPQDPNVRNLFLTAPAVDRVSIEQGEKFFASTQRCDDVYVLHSRHDKVLEFGFPVGEALSGSVGAVALGFQGLANAASVGANVHVVDCQAFVNDHSDYRKRLELYAIVGTVLAGQQPAAAPAGNLGVVNPNIC